jgi:hypothetical protein
MIGLNLWQKPQQIAVAAAFYASQITRAKLCEPRHFVRLQPRTRGGEGEFGHLSLCGNGSLSISHRSENGSAPGGR